LAAAPVISSSRAPSSVNRGAESAITWPRGTPFVAADGISVAAASEGFQ
jgi:hypothetical protein